MTTDVNQNLTLEELKKQAEEVKDQEVKAGQKIQLIVFKLAGEEYALPIDHIKEVVLTPGMAKIPQTPDYIKGVANIRGNIIAIMDLEEKFALSTTDEGQENSGLYTLVIESENFKTGILVTEVPNTLNAYPSDIDSSSSVMQYSSMDEDCISGIVKKGHRLIILLDVFRMMEKEDSKVLTRI